ncbi:hypothetical protein MBLNU13_g04651t1 [Cladosporium sp. NU13]
MIQCDPAIIAIIEKLNEEHGRGFIRDRLDDEHLLIKTERLDELKGLLNALDMLGVATQYVDEQLRVKAILLGLGPMYGAYGGFAIADEVSTVMRDFKISDHIGYFAADNASNNDSALRHIAKEIDFDPVRQRIRCNAQILNLVAKAILYGTDSDCVADEEIRYKTEDGSPSNMVSLTWWSIFAAFSLTTSVGASPTGCINAADPDSGFGNYCYCPSNKKCYGGSQVRKDKPQVQDDRAVSIDMGRFKGAKNYNVIRDGLRAGLKVNKVTETLTIKSLRPGPGDRIDVVFANKDETSRTKQHTPWLTSSLAGARVKGEQWYPVKSDSVVKHSVLDRDSWSKSQMH